MSKIKAKQPGRANRGRALEELISLSADAYRRRGIALIEKIPTEWIPTRNGQGKIVSAKVTRKAPVDFFGGYQGRAIAFDAKSTASHRMEWKALEPHQQDFLEDFTRTGNPGFILAAFEFKEFFMIPWEFWREGATLRQQGKGMASFTAEEVQQYKIEHPGKGTRAPLDFLQVVDRL